MPDRFVTLDDNLALPPSVKVLAGNLPASGVPKTMVGLGNVDNTTDAGKPVSTAQQTALNAKQTRGELFINAKDVGAKGDAKKFTTGGAITTGTAGLALTGATFTAADVGKLIYVLGAGAAGAVLSTTISAFVDATHVTLAANAGTTVTNAQVIYGTDDTAAINTALSNMQNGGVNELLLPFGSYLVGTLLVKNNAVIRGQQRGAWAYDFPERTTRLLVKPGMAAAPVITDFTAVQVGNVRLFDFMIDGNKAFQTNAQTGIYLSDSATSADSLWTIERVYVGYMSGDGCYLGVYRRANRINDSHFFQCAGNGIRIDGTDNSIFQTVVAQNGGHGFWLNQGANHFFGCDIFVNTGHGAKIEALGRMNEFTNCFFDTNLKCGVYTEAKNTSLVQCRFTSNSQEADGVYPDVDIVGGPPGCALINPQFYTMPGTITNLPYSGIRAVGNNYANLVYVVGFSFDPGVTTWRSGSYVEASVGILHKGFTIADGAKVGTGGVNGTVLGGATDRLAFFGKAAGIAQPSVAGPKGSDAVTTSLVTALAALGLVTDSTGVALATKTANYTVTTGDRFIIGNGAALTFTLPDPSTLAAGQQKFVVKNINAGALTVVSAGASKTIDGATSLSLGKWGSAEFISDGTNWLTLVPGVYTSPNGTRFQVGVDDTGALTTTSL